MACAFAWLLFIPRTFVLTSFGGESDRQPLACVGVQSNGSWYYSADAEVYGCGTHLRVEANDRCAVVVVQDYGPAAWVSRLAHAPVLDASPRLGHYLFGEEVGWSDALQVTVTPVSEDTPVGPCQ